MSKTFRIQRVKYDGKAHVNVRGTFPEVEVLEGEADPELFLTEGDMITFLQDTSPQIFLKVRVHGDSIEVTIAEDGDLD